MHKILFYYNFIKCLYMFRAHDQIYVIVTKQIDKNI